MTEKLPEFVRDHIENSIKIKTQKFGEETIYFLDGITIKENNEFYNIIVDGVDVGVLASSELRRRLKTRLRRERKRK